jgi:hypothetical protein
MLVKENVKAQLEPTRLDVLLANLRKTSLMISALRKGPAAGHLQKIRQLKFRETAIIQLEAATNFRAPAHFIHLQPVGLIYWLKYSRP